MWEWHTMWWGLFGFILMAVFWIAIIVLVVWGVKRVSGIRRESSPFDIARERYAKGEISREEFEQFKKDLS